MKTIELSQREITTLLYVINTRLSSIQGFGLDEINILSSLRKKIKSIEKYLKKNVSVSFVKTF